MFDVEELVNMAWSGKIRVPHFQRDFRWGWEDVSKLFDSVVKGYPIGSLLLWSKKGDEEVLKLGALRINAPQTSDARWVVDGQQRLTSLANALHPEGQKDPRFAIAYDLDEDRFVRPRQVENPSVIPLPVLFDLQQLLKWFASYPQISEHLDGATKLTRAIRQFSIPAYIVVEEDTRVLQDIFDRMNNYGKRLSRAEVFSALNASDEVNRDGSRGFEKIAERLMEDYNFGLIDNDTVLAAVLARRGSNVRRDIRNEFEGESQGTRDEAYDAGERALGHAIQFLQQEAGVPHFAMLAYRYLLVVLARFFAFFPDADRRSLQLLRRWYWRAAEAGPELFKGGSTNAARVLGYTIVEADLIGSLQRLLNAIPQWRHRPSDTGRFATNEASTKMLLCGWWSLEPRNLTSGEIYTLADLTEAIGDGQTAHDAVSFVLPRLTAQGSLRKLPANRLLMPGLEVDQNEVIDLIINTPLDLDPDTWTTALASHLIGDSALSALIQGDSGSFLALRQREITTQMTRFMARMQEWNFEDTPPLSELVMSDDEVDAHD